MHFGSANKSMTGDGDTDPKTKAVDEGLRRGYPTSPIYGDCVRISSRSAVHRAPGNAPGQEIVP